MEKTLTIRKCEKKDGDEVFRFICQLEGENPEKNSFNNIFLENIQKENIFYVVAELNSKIIGFGSMHIQNLLHHTGKIAEIQELFIDSVYRSAGYGEEILLYLRDIALNMGCKHFEAVCNIVRDKAYGFFLKMGMSPTHNKFTERL